MQSTESLFENIRKDFQYFKEPLEITNNLFILIMHQLHKNQIKSLILLLIIIKITMPIFTEQYMH